MKSALQPLWLALSLLTVLPVGRAIAAPVAEADLGRSPLYYPAAGLLIGGLLAGAAMLLAAVDARLAAVIVLALGVALTGALHLDGLADSVDALFAGHRDRERCLAVLRDPAVGPMGVVVLLLRLLLEYAALVVLFERATAATLAAVLVTAAVLARAAALALMATTAYRRAEGLAAVQSQRLSRPAAAVVLVAVAVAAPVALGPGLGIAMLTISAVLVVAWRRLWQAAIGGYTGDVIGALIELVQVAVLVLAGVAPAWA